MKKIIIIFGALIIGVMTASNSVGQCLTDTSIPDPLACLPLPPPVAGKITLRVNAHIIADGIGNGGITESDVKTAVSRIADDLAPFDICISLHKIELVSNDNYFLNGPPFSAFNSPNAFDIIFLPATFNGCCGASNITSTKISILGTWNLPGGGQLPSFLSHTVSHEFGHALGLYHTFRGGPCEPAGSCLEFVNGSNAQTCGDCIQDTPADPCVSFNSGHVLSNCQLDPSIIFNPDPNGNLYVPDLNNIMSYTYPNCGTHFSQGQGLRMRYNLQTNSIFTPCIITDEVFVQNFSANNTQELFSSPGNLTSGNNVTSTFPSGVVQFTLNSKIDFMATEYIDLESGFHSDPLGGPTNEISGYFNAQVDPNYCSSTSILNNARLSKNFNSNYSSLLSNTVWLSSSMGMEGYENILNTKLNDTIINGIVYSKVLEQYIDLPGVWNNPFLNGSYYIYLREDTISRKVYKYYTNGEMIILDFSLQIGDTLYNQGQNYFILNSIDSILTYSGYKKRFIFTDTTSIPIVWVEGLGNLAYPFSFNRKYYQANSNILCIHKEGTLVYEYLSMISVTCNLYNNIYNNSENSFNIYPNPSSNQFTLEFSEAEKSEKEIRIYDLTGRLVIHQKMDNFKINIDISSLDNGVYLVLAKDGNLQFSKKFIKSN